MHKDLKFPLMRNVKGVRSTTKIFNDIYQNNYLNHKYLVEITAELNETGSVSKKKDLISVF